MAFRPELAQEGPCLVRRDLGGWSGNESLESSWKPPVLGDHSLVHADVDYNAAHLELRCYNIPRVPASPQWRRKRQQLALSTCPV